MTDCQWTASETGFVCTVCGRPFPRSDVRRNCRSRGLGDTVAKVTTALGIKPCGGCKRRQEKLNELVPYGQKP